MRFAKRILAFGLFLTALGVTNFSYSDCHLTCRVLTCQKSPTYGCMSAEPAQCAGQVYWLIGAGNATYVCDIIQPESQVKSRFCDDCHAECPEIGKSEATNCTGCGNFTESTKKRCVEVGTSMPGGEG